MNNFNVTRDILDKLKHVDIRAYLSSEYNCDFNGGYVCQCPHPDHNDSNPSFAVHVDQDGENSWWCHGCHIGKIDLHSEHKNYGTDFIGLLRWLSDYKGSPHVLTFQEAAAKACEYAGINYITSYIDPEWLNYTIKNKSIAHSCSEQLLENKNNEAYRYLISRGLEQDDLEKWMLGWNGERIVFPLMSRNQNIIGFSNRLLHENSTEGKYVNTANGPYFTKGEYLYGIHNVDPSLGYLYITEGQMDVIMATKYGLKNVVASLGTAFTEKHLETISSLHGIEEIIFVFDADPAGQKKIPSCAAMARDAGYCVSYVDLPDGMDLCDFSLSVKDNLTLEIHSRTAFYFYQEFKKTQEEFDRTMFAAQNRVISKLTKINENITSKKERQMFKSYIQTHFNILVSD